MIFELRNKKSLTFYQLNANKSRGEYMIFELRNKKSLTFYQPTSITPQKYVSSAYTGGLIATTISETGYATISTTTQFNDQLNSHLNYFHNESDRISQKVINGLENNSYYDGARSNGVKLAWKYEKADVEMGGKGSADWNAYQQQEIKETGKVAGAEGHHQKNVADHPKDQGNANNIKFYKNRQEHLKKGHNGNFQNESNADYIDKDTMLKKTNWKRVFRNEIKGVAIAAAIGAGIGFTIGFATTLARSGVAPDTLKYAIAEGAKSGASVGIQSIIGYGIGRTIGQLATHALEGVLSNLGITVTKNISQMCNMGVFGAVTIAVFSTYQFIKLIREGMACKEAIIQVGKQALFSLSLLAVSIAAQGIWGGPAGIVVSISIGIILIAYTIVDTVHQRELSEKIRIYMIGRYKPVIV